MSEYDPFIIAPTCIYIASKVEECNGRINPQAICDHMKRRDPSFCYQQEHILSTEFDIILALKFNLIIYHCINYMNVIEYTRIRSDKVCKDIVAAANDMYLTDVPLMHPPYAITLAAIFVGAIICNNLDLRWWFAQFEADVMKEIWEISSELLAMYSATNKDTTQDAFGAFKKINYTAKK